MAQIIKHRRGGVGSVKDITTRNAELIVSSGSIGDMNGPFVLIGSPTLGDEGLTGIYKPVSKIYQGATVPTITVGSYGNAYDGTPYYSSNDQTLYILAAAGNTNMDLTGNLEGRSIDKITLSSLNGSINVTGSVVISQNISGFGFNIPNKSGTSPTFAPKEKDPFLNWGQYVLGMPSYSANWKGWVQP
jgi:hypothetical protein